MAASLALSRKTFAQSERTKLRVAIVGGGAAGLTAAYRLQASGFKPSIFEASDRLGGRMFTKNDFHKGLFCELGGEFVDTKHADLQALCRDLGVPLQPLTSEESVAEDLYFFGNQFYTMRDVLDPRTKTGAFLPIAAKLTEDKSKLLEGEKAWSAFARELDALSLADYLAQFRGKAPPWVLALLDCAYRGEFGLDTARQSSLNFVDLITTDLTAPFAIFGESDEAFRIQGGSSSLIEALTARCAPACTVETNAKLIAFAARGKAVELTLATAKGQRTEHFDFAVFTLPFTALRAVEGIAALSPDKVRAVQDLGYGNNAKVMVGTNARPWHDAASGFPAVSNGNVYSDLPFQAMWDTSRMQPGEQGVLSNFFAGQNAAKTLPEAIQALRAGLSACAPTIAESLDEQAVVSMFWERHPHTLGSYSAAMPGQYTTLLEATATPEFDGRLHFAGEHTSSEFLGYMNGAVQSGNRAAQAVLAMAGER